MSDHLSFGNVPRRGPWRRVVSATAVMALLLAACSPESDRDDVDGPDGARSTDGSSTPPVDPDALVATVSTAQEGTVVLDGGDPGTLAAATTAHFFAQAPVVVLTSAEEQLRAASAAVALGVPVLVDGPGTSVELDRLGTQVALVVGAVQDPGIDVVVPADDPQLASHVGGDGERRAAGPDHQVQQVVDLDPATPVLLVPDRSDGTGSDDTGDGSAGEGDDGAGTTTGPETSAPLASDRDELPQTALPSPLEGVLVLSTGDPTQTAAVGTARAAGAQVLVVPDGDPGATSESLSAFADAGSGATSLVGLGAEFGDPDSLDWRARVAATGVELPGGGLTALPGKTYVALYGTPSTGALGVLGEQPIEQTIIRAQEHASWYQPLTDEPVVPTLEIIATVAAQEAGPDGNYSNELPVEQLRPLVELAAENDVYVVLDLQPGRTDFLTQAQIYEELLRLPHVGLALDPEWRLGPDEMHMVRIGSVEVDEVNRVVDWMAGLVQEHDLPQKILVLHQFQIRMIPGADDVDQSRPEVAVLIHADGQGPHASKMDTWAALHNHAPNMEHWGWKNFYDEDVPGPFTPEATMQVEPTPNFISYQ
jgi:hypothetical protein